MAWHDSITNHNPGPGGVRGDRGCGGGPGPARGGDARPDRQRASGDGAGDLPHAGDVTGDAGGGGAGGGAVALPGAESRGGGTGPAGRCSAADELRGGGGGGAAEPPPRGDRARVAGEGVAAAGAVAGAGRGGRGSPGPAQAGGTPVGGEGADERPAVDGDGVPGVRAVARAVRGGSHRARRGFRTGDGRMGAAAKAAPAGDRGGDPGRVPRRGRGHGRPLEAGARRSPPCRSREARGSRAQPPRGRSHGRPGLRAGQPRPLRHTGGEEARGRGPVAWARGPDPGRGPGCEAAPAPGGPERDRPGHDEPGRSLARGEAVEPAQGPSLPQRRRPAPSPAPALRHARR